MSCGPATNGVSVCRYVTEPRVIDSAKGEQAPMLPLADVPRVRDDRRRSGEHTKHCTSIAPKKYFVEDPRIQLVKFGGKLHFS